MDNRIGKENDGSSLSTQDKTKTLRFSFLINTKLCHFYDGKRKDKENNGYEKG